MDYKNGSAKGSAGMRGVDDDKKLFVGGLPKPCGEKDLRETFSKFGSIESINIKMNPITGASRGFCFIVFTESKVVDEIIAHGDIYISGKKVDPRKVTKSPIPGKIFVGGLTPEFTEDKIKDFFGQKGNIIELQWPYDKQKNQKKNFCFLTFENRDTATEYLKTPKLTVFGKELDIKTVKGQTDRQYGANVGGAYAVRGRGSYFPPCAPYNFTSYDCTPEYTGFDDYYSVYPADPYTDGYSTCYDTAYAPRPPRGGRATGGYIRHTPY